MRLYLVMGTAGEYESRRLWTVKGYLNKRLAEHHMKRAQHRACEIICKALDIPFTEDLAEIGSSKYDYRRLNEVEDEENVWDPGFHSDYSRNVRYFVSGAEIYLDSTPPDEE